MTVHVCRASAIRKATACCTVFITRVQSSTSPSPVRFGHAICPTHFCSYVSVLPSSVSSHAQALEFQPVSELNDSIFKQLFLSYVSQLPTYPSNMPVDMPFAQQASLYVCRPYMRPTSWQHLQQMVAICVQWPSTVFVLKMS